MTTSQQELTRILNLPKGSIYIVPMLVEAELLAPLVRRHRTDVEIKSTGYIFDRGWKGSDKYLMLSTRIPDVYIKHLAFQEAIAYFKARKKLIYLP